MMSKFEELKKINVNEHTEKKNNLTYLSWAWAVDVLLTQDPTATWEYADPKMFGETLMVFCTVHAFGKSMTAQLPVMDYRNKAIPNPDAFAVNTAMQRCLAKAIALHGLGLYIYAGEDLPDESNYNGHDADTANSNFRQQDSKPADADKGKKLPRLTDEEAEAAFNKWAEEKQRIADASEDGIADPSVINAAWFKRPSNERSAITRWGNMLKQQEQLDKQGSEHIKSITKEAA